MGRGLAGPPDGTAGDRPCRGAADGGAQVHHGGGQSPAGGAAGTGGGAAGGEWGGVQASWPPCGGGGQSGVRVRRPPAQRGGKGYARCWRRAHRLEDGDRRAAAATGGAAAGVWHRGGSGYWWGWRPPFAFLCRVGRVYLSTTVAYRRGGLEVVTLAAVRVSIVPRRDGSRRWYEQRPLPPRSGRRRDWVADEKQLKRPTRELQTWTAPFSCLFNRPVLSRPNPPPLPPPSFV